MKDSQRLGRNDTFRFACGPHVPCFTECCGKLELLLTPYDVMRLRKSLSLSSDEFVDNYTDMRWKTANGFPEVIMKMNPDSKRCPFVTDQGCSVYDDRPAACRIYPLGRASTSHPMDGSRREFFFTVREDHCRGFEQPKEWLISEWLQDQGVEEYNRVNDILMELYVMRSRGRSVSFGPQHIQMFMMACYMTEKFKDFIFKSAFLKKFDIAPDLVEAIRNDDYQLLEFGFTWLKFALFGLPVISVKAG